MKKAIDWVQEHVAPAVGKLNSNPYVMALQGGFQQVVPVILVGSFANLITTVKNLVSWLPDLSVITNYTFGLIGLFLAFIVPYGILEAKGQAREKVIAGFSGVAIFVLLTADADMNIQTGYFGTGGMTTAIIFGLIVGAVLSNFYKLGLLKNSPLPPAVATWFETIIPLFVMVLCAYLAVKNGFDAFNFFTTLFGPLQAVGNTLFGFIIFYFITALFYVLGLSAWAIWPVFALIALPNMAANVELVAAGQPAAYINTVETVYVAFLCMGGTGCTLALNVLALFGKSKHVKSMGFACIAPSLFNINEPIMYGLPVCLNPILMIPYLIVAVVIPILTWVVLKIGLVPIPAMSFLLTYIPYPIGAWMLCGIMGVLLVLVIFAVTAAIFYPFLSVYDRQMLEEEAKEVNA